MVNRPKAIGTAGETAVVRYVAAHGFNGAERIALHGIADQGDVSLCPGVMVEVKSGHAAEQASDATIAEWLADTERERVARGCDVAFLVTKRRGKGAANAGAWWAHMSGDTFASLGCMQTAYASRIPTMRTTLAEACTLIRACGYGTPLHFGGSE